MATDADIVPQGVTDFVFDLSDSVTLSQLTEEQGRLYNNVFRDLSQKVIFFSKTYCIHDGVKKRKNDHNEYIIHRDLTNMFCFLIIVKIPNLPSFSTLPRLRGRLPARLQPSVMAIHCFSLFTVN